MLSRIKMIVLGVISETPMSAYDMTKYIQDIGLRQWVPISDSAIYNAARTLQQKGYIEGEAAREGNMPEKTIYTITEKGCEELKKSVESTLLSLDTDYLTFSVMTLFLYLLDEKQIIALLKKRIQKLKKKLKNVKALDAFTVDHHLSCAVHLSNVRSIGFIKVEIETANEMLQIMQSGRGQKELHVETLKVVHQLLLENGKRAVHQK